MIGLLDVIVLLGALALVGCIAFALWEERKLDGLFRSLAGYRQAKASGQLDKDVIDWSKAARR